MGEARNEIEKHLETYGIEDKDTNLSSVTHERRRSQRFKRIDKIRRERRMVLDLHRMSEEEAAGEINRAIAECKSNGIKRILIIHGQGHHSHPHQGPVLGRLVRIMLEYELRPFIKTFRSASLADGGIGATRGVARLSVAATALIFLFEPYWSKKRCEEKQFRNSCGFWALRRRRMTALQLKRRG